MCTSVDGINVITSTPTTIQQKLTEDTISKLFPSNKATQHFSAIFVEILRMKQLYQFICSPKYAELKNTNRDNWLQTW